MMLIFSEADFCVDPWRAVKRAGLYTDYTFAVWQGETLVPFAKTYSGLTDEEIREVDRFIQRNTVEQFGPVRSVRPE